MTSAIRDALAVLAEPGQVVEVRVLGENGTHSGYFTDADALARQAEALDADPSVHGMYVTLNAVNPALIARRANRIKMHLSHADATTADADITRRLWLPVDIDPVRPSGVSSTESEHGLALAKADEIASWLAGLGFTDPIRGDSGNGAHLLYRVDLANDDAGTAVVKGCLATLDLLFSDEQVMVDRANYNAGRIWKLYGTVARKGDSTPERPHRRSRIIAVPAGISIVSRDALDALATQLPQSPNPEPAGQASPPGGVIDLRAWLVAHQIAIRREKAFHGGTLFSLAQCPFSSAHTSGAYAIQFANGAISAACQHTTCGSRQQRWRELREKYETPEEKHARQKRQIRGWSKKRSEGKAKAENLPGLPGETQGKVTVPEYPMTDAGNAERLKVQYGDVIRYCATDNSWYLWDGTVWVRDDVGKMLLITTSVARSIHREAADALSTDQSRALSRWAIFSESLHARKAMIESATPHVPVMPDEFDSQPYLFNCRNGTLDLSTMNFYPHRKEDLLTKKAAVEYDPAAECPQWIAHLTLIFAGDLEYLSGFQAMCGYTMLGINPQQLMFILYGRGRNGKSKTIEVLSRIFASYAVNIAAESLVAKRFETPRSDLARLSGARFATAAEGAEDARMDESVIKQLTGEHALTVRKLYENEFEFPPITKIWLTTNHEPKISGTDDGIWRRLWMLPFAVQIPPEKCDQDIATKLLSESSGILNWCLAGLLQYYANGNLLVQPKKVSQATTNLRTVSDTVGLFLATECAFEPGVKMSRSALRETLMKWCEEEGINRVPTARKLATTLTERGVVDGGKTMSDRFWSGIRLKTDAERSDFEKVQSAQQSFVGI